MSTLHASPTRYRDPRARAGTLEVICGCMFAGKTEALIDRVLSHAPHRVQVFKHAADQRYHRSRVVSHRQRSCSATPIAHAAQLIDQIGGDVDLVAVDEGHFFDDRLPDVCAELTDLGIQVVVATLDDDCWSRPFPMIVVLQGMADTVNAKSARCARCGHTGTRTQRLTPIVDGKIVGGAESFEPRCGQCWTPPPVSCAQITRVASNTGPCVQQSS